MVSSVIQRLELLLQLLADVVGRVRLEVEALLPLVRVGLSTLTVDNLHVLQMNATGKRSLVPPCCNHMGLGQLCKQGSDNLSIMFRCLSCDCCLRCVVALLDRGHASFSQLPARAGPVLHAGSATFCTLHVPGQLF